jgi:hypothetical protein
MNYPIRNRRALVTNEGVRQRAARPVAGASTAPTTSASSVAAQATVDGAGYGTRPTIPLALRG